MKAYIVCKKCKLGVIDGSWRVKEFQDEHLKCGCFELVPEPIFLSEWLEIGYKDIEHPDLKPIPLRLNAGAAPMRHDRMPMPFGKPKTVAENLRAHREMTATAPLFERSAALHVEEVAKKPLWSRIFDRLRRRPQ